MMNTISKEYSLHSGHEVIAGTVSQGHGHYAAIAVRYYHNIPKQSGKPFHKMLKLIKSILTILKRHL